MGNARYAVKQIAEKVIGTNVEHAVQREMRAILEGLG
jgi:hydroxymethylpyrimidine pyrophosphatase-like HAD family hydrolase